MKIVWIIPTYNVLLLSISVLFSVWKKLKQHFSFQHFVKSKVNLFRDRAGGL